MQKEIITLPSGRRLHLERRDRPNQSHQIVLWTLDKNGNIDDDVVHISKWLGIPSSRWLAAEISFGGCQLRADEVAGFVELLTFAAGIAPVLDRQYATDAEVDQ